MSNEQNTTLNNDEADYQRGHTAGSYVADNAMDKETWEALAIDLKNETFKRGFEDGKRHMQSCGGDLD